MKQHTYPNTEGDRRNTVDDVLAARKKDGYADVAQFGFAAVVANAMPPADNAFRQTLRDRIEEEASKQARQRAHVITSQRRRQPAYGQRTARLGRLALVAASITVLVLIGAYLALGGLDPWSRLGIARPAPRPETGVPSTWPESQLASADVEALAQRLNAEPDARTVAVFPGEYAPVLAELVDHPVVPVALEGMVSPVTLQAALGAVLPGSGLVDAVLVGLEEEELARQVRVALEQRLYRLYRGPGDAGEESFGTLERKVYVAGPEDLALSPVGVTLSNGVTLVAAAVLDTPQPGEPLRVALDWRAEELVSDPMMVFTHVFCDGRLVAQRDAVPGNGEFPVQTWVPGELVRDQFAVLFPETETPGTCEIQVGIYNPSSGMRYIPIDAEGPPYVVIQ